MRRLALIAVLASAVTVPGGAAAAATPRASLTDIENDVMCVSCKEPLALAQSPQAIRERDEIRRLIAQGLTKAQIEHQLVVDYGVAVLGRPPAHGFNLTVYIVPPALVVAGLLTLALTLPRWRRRARAAAAAQSQAGAPTSPALDPVQAKRLNDDLARYD